MKSEGRTAKPKKRTNGATRWALQIFIFTLFLSAAMSLGSDFFMQGANLWVAMVVLIVLIVVGVVSDMLGVAITTADQAPFVAMASKRVKGAKQSISILKNAERYANILNDVIGDIASIVSGGAVAVISALLSASFPAISVVMWLVITSALTSAVMVSLKSLGKVLAISKCHQLVFSFGRFLALFSH